MNQMSSHSIKFGSIRNRIADNRLCKKEYLFLLALIAFSFIPSVNQLIVDRFITNIGGDVLDIAGQIEWFDLFNETILAFLTVPLYFVFNRAKDDEEFSRCAEPFLRLRQFRGLPRESASEA